MVKDTTPISYDSLQPEGMLPTWLHRQGNGKLWYMEGVDGKRGPWDFIADFGTTLAKLREPLDLGQGKDAWGGKVTFNENLSAGIVSAPFKNVTILANGFPLGDLDTQFLYTVNFMAGVRPAMERAIEHVGKGAVVLAPERGGRVPKIMLAAAGFSEAQMPFYSASRKILPDGTYTVALSFADPIPQGVNFLHFDDCGATGGTEVAGYLAAAGINGKPRRYASVVGVGVRRSINLRAGQLEGEGVDYRIDVGAESNVMDTHYYLGVTDQEAQVLGVNFAGGYRVNDMGTAMNFETPERLAEVPLFTAIAAGAIADEIIIGVTSEAVSQPYGDGSRVHQAAEALRQLVR